MHYRLQKTTFNVLKDCLAPAALSTPLDGRPPAVASPRPIPVKMDIINPPAQFYFSPLEDEMEYLQMSYLKHQQERVDKDG